MFLELLPSGFADNASCYEADSKHYLIDYHHHHQTASVATEALKQVELHIPDSSISLMSASAEEGVLEGGVFPPSQKDFQHVQPTLRFPSQNLCRAIFDIYLEPATLVPTARQQWIAFVRQVIGAR